ncbi:hypothetical protein OIK40_13090 [Erythrobacter sp. sf7]|uniref:Biopolymer transporter ExbD n=1 Tax=Erythrobacter fulvus TaxID=2987523 RepID=A0ABT5JTX5_9SPHN|nr:hypothetical protein [Erythrobacter fulvus]MDC8755578.1 hypothetical protein [Erythrobacter fulvus]
MSAKSLEMKIGGHGWQLILADLALILFLVTLSSLPASDAVRGEKPRARLRIETAAAQALYRPVSDGPTLSAWLAAQPRDPRATLTIFAHYRPGGEAAAWDAAAAMAADIAASGVPVRTVIAPGEEADLYASLAYDSVVAK